MSENSVCSHTHRLTAFFAWCSSQSIELPALEARDVDAYVASLHAKGFKPHTIATDCQRLRTFFRYAESTGLTRSHLAGALQSPRPPRFQSEPKGPRWSDVRKLLTPQKNKSAAGYRARAVIALCAIYGLRGKEVRSLLLDDIDWSEEIITIRRAKSGRAQRFPLQFEVGEAIMEYIRFARPHTSQRVVFLALQRPFHPLSQSGLRGIIAKRMTDLGIESPQRSTHCLRHSCATQLLHKGRPLAEIADFLGHSNTNSVSVYAKVSRKSISRVAKFSLDDVL